MVRRTIRSVLGAISSGAVLLVPLLLVAAPTPPSRGPRHLDWIEKNPARYIGRYLDFVESVDAEGSSHLTCLLEIRVQSGKIAATYSVKPDGNTRESKEVSVELERVTILRNHFGAFFPAAEKSRFKYPVPRSFAGRFVHRYPPINARGSVDQGLLIGDQFFVRSERPR
jgi:hypothetical protein